jgi:ADP-heptose:LPS heptosyltransferase
MRTDLPLLELKKLLAECKTWISVDTFFQHLAWSEGKKGIVLWGPSDPLIYGHPENVNLLANRDLLASNQFLMWEQQEYNENRFVKPDVVARHLEKFFN